MPFLSKINTINAVEYDSNIKNGIRYLGADVVTGVFSTFTHSWIACDSTLFIIKHSDGSLQCSWTFGDKADSFEITCVMEFQIEGCAIPLLIVGVSSQTTNKICFFNPNTRKVIRTIECNFPVRVLCVVEDGLSNANPINSALSTTQGLLAVGCADGSIYVIDLCRSLLLKALYGNFQFVRDESRPVGMCVIDNSCVSESLVQEKLEECYRSHDSLALHLSDDAEDGITALCYSFESAILFAGTSTGSIFLWNMTTLDCIFQSESTSHAVTSLSLLEPCDDPKHNLFLWVSYENYSQAIMYSIAFSKKYTASGYGSYYQGFESVGIVYRLKLGEDMRVVRSINSLAVARSISKNLAKSFRIPGPEGTQLRLFVTGFETVRADGVESCKVVVFDLNQWYKEQLPEEGLSSCVEVLELGPVAGGVWYLALDPSSLAHYQWVRPLEQHFHPSALDFRFWCVETEGIRCLEKLGLQSQWLKNMLLVGPSALLAPQQIFQGAISAGLLPTFIDPPDLDFTTVEEERKYILTVCLENRAVSVVEHCAREWSTGSHPVAGCTLAFLIDWLWELHATYKSHGNRMCVPLFDQSGLEFDVSERKTLQHCKSLLSIVQVLYTNIIRTYSNFIFINGLEQKLAAMSLVSFYFECCLKFISANLLPEPNDAGRPTDSISYKFNEINNYVGLRRKEGPFLGDTLLGRSGGEKEWEEEGGTGWYPPPSVQSVLRYCLHPSPTTSNKLSLILYLYMDIINSHTPIRNEECLEKVDNFQFLLRVSDGQYKIVTALWFLDHNFFDEGISLLLDPRVLLKDISQEQHRSILRLLFQNGQEKLALRYLRLKTSGLHQLEDFRLELDLLLGVRLINEAFIFQRKHPEYREDLLIQFFRGCLEKKLLGHVFGLHLDSKEESVLFKFLSSLDVENKGDLQVQFLLSRGKYTEAVSLNDRLNSTKLGPKGKLNTRDLIVRGITGGIDTTSRDMAYEMKHYKPPPPGTRPKPLSTLIKIRNEADGPLLQVDSRVLISAAAKSVRHLADYIKENETKNKKRCFDEEEPMDVSLDNPPLKRACLQNPVTGRMEVVPTWLTTPCKTSSSREREVMELVGTPLVRKSGRKPSPHSKPSSILKAKAAQIADDTSSTPIRKTLRFALPDNEKHVLSGRSLFSANKDAEEVEDLEKDASLRLLRERICGRKCLHPAKTSDELPSTPVKESSNTSSIMESIRDRLRSSSKSKLMTDGAVDWQNVAATSQPKMLFTPGSGRKKVSKQPVPRSVVMKTVTPRSEETFLGITITSAEKRSLESPSWQDESSLDTQAIFNTTLTKRLFSNQTLSEDVDTDPNEESSLEKYKRLRRGQLTNNPPTKEDVKANNQIYKPLDENCKSISDSKNIENTTDVTASKSLIEKNASPKIKKPVTLENQSIPNNNTEEKTKDTSKASLDENKGNVNDVLIEKSIDINKTKPKESFTPDKNKVINIELEDSEEEEANPSDEEADESEPQASKSDEEAVASDEEEDESEPLPSKSDEEAVASDVEADESEPLASKSDEEAFASDVEADESEPLASKSDDEAVETDEEAIESDNDAVESDKEIEGPFITGLSMNMVGTISEEEFKNMQWKDDCSEEQAIPTDEAVPSDGEEDDSDPASESSNESCESEGSLSKKKKESAVVIDLSSSEEKEVDNSEVDENSSNRSSSSNFSFSSHDVYGDLGSSLDYGVLGIPRNQNQNQLNLDTEDSIVERTSTLSDDILPKSKDKKLEDLQEKKTISSSMVEITTDESLSENISDEENFDCDNKEDDVESPESNLFLKCEEGEEELDPFAVEEPYPNIDEIPIDVDSDSSDESLNNDQDIFETVEGDHFISTSTIPDSLLNEIVPIKVASKYVTKSEKSKNTEPLKESKTLQESNPDTVTTPTDDESMKEINKTSSVNQVSISPNSGENKLETHVENVPESSQHENLVLNLIESPTKLSEEIINTDPQERVLEGSMISESQSGNAGFQASEQEEEPTKSTSPDGQMDRLETSKLLPTDPSADLPGECEISSEQAKEDLPQLQNINRIEPAPQKSADISESEKTDSNEESEITTTVLESNEIDINTDVGTCISPNIAVPSNEGNSNKTLSIQIEDVSSNTESTEACNVPCELQAKSSETLDAVSNDLKLSQSSENTEAENSSIVVFSLESNDVDLVYSGIAKPSNTTTQNQSYVDQEDIILTSKFDEVKKSSKLSHISGNTDEIANSKTEISTTVSTTDLAKAEQVARIGISECIAVDETSESATEPLSDATQPVTCDSSAFTRPCVTSSISSNSHITLEPNTSKAGQEEVTLQITEPLTLQDNDADTLSTIIHIPLQVDSASLNVSESVSAKNKLSSKTTNLSENSEVIKDRSGMPSLMANSVGAAESSKVEMKSFFFGRDEKSESYLQTTARATFQVGSRISLPNEDEPVDPMEMAMIEQEESMAKESDDTDPRNTCMLDADLSLHLSDDEVINDTKPKMADKSTVTANSYLAQKASKSKLRNNDRTKEIFAKQVITIDPVKEDKKIPAIPSNKNNDKPTKHSIGIQSDNFTAEPGESLNVKLQPDSDKECRRQRRCSTSSQSSNKDTELKGILKNKNESSLAKTIETKSENSDDPHETKSYRRSRRSSVTSQISDAAMDMKYKSEETEVSKKSVKEPELQGILKKSKKIEPSVSSECRDITPSKRRHSVSVDDSAPKEKQSRKSSRSSILESVKDLFHSTQDRRRRSSVEPGLQGILKSKTKRRSSSCTSETAIDLNSRLEDFSDVQRRSRGYSEEPDLLGILKRKGDSDPNTRASSSRHSDVLDVQYTSDNKEKRRSRRFSEELPSRGILKNKYELTTNDVENYRKDDLSLGQRRGRSSLGSQSSATTKVSGRKSGRRSLASDIELEGYRDKHRLRSYSEEPEIRGILKNSERHKKRSYTSETSSDLKLRLEEDFPEVKKSRSKSLRYSSTSDVSSQNSDSKDRLHHDVLKEKRKSVNAADDDERYMTSSRRTSVGRSDVNVRLSYDDGPPEERKGRTRRKSSSEEPTERRRSSRQTTPESKLKSSNDENRKKSTSPKSSSANRKLDYSEEDNSIPNKSISLQDKTIRRSSRLRSTILEVIAEEDEVTPMKKKKKSPDMLESHKLSKDVKAQKKREVRNVEDISVPADRDHDSDDTISEMNALAEGYATELKLTRTQKKALLSHVNLLEGMSPSKPTSEKQTPSTSSDTSTPRKGGRRTPVSRSLLSKSPSPSQTPSLTETPTRTSLRLQRKPPSQAGD